MFSKKFVEKAGEYFAFRFESWRRRKRYKVHVLPPRKIVDIITTTTSSSDWHKIIKYGNRFIDAKGESNEYPTDTKVYKSMRKLPPTIFPKKYFIYLVFNVRLNKIPGLAILDGKYVKKFGKISTDKNTINIHQVNYNTKSGIIEIYRLPRLTSRVVADIRYFIKKKKVLPSRRMPQIPVESRYDKLLDFIRNLSDDIIEQRQRIRIAFSSRSRRGNRNMRLAWVCRLEHSGTPTSFWVWVRKDTSEMPYPEIISTISNYKADGGFGYPAFKISSNRDLERAKKIIKFAYDRL